MDRLPHGTPLSPAARAIVLAERPERPQHLGTVYVLRPGSGVTLAALRALVASRLHLAPHLRWLLWRPPVPRAQPLWVPDEGFDLTRHVRAVRVSDGVATDRDLQGLCGRLLSTPLARDLPPWDMVLVEGLTDDGAAIVVRAHLALADVPHGLELGATLLGLDADPALAAALPAVDPDAAASVAAGSAAGADDTTATATTATTAATAATRRRSRRALLGAAVREAVPGPDELVERAVAAVSAPDELGRQLLRGAGRLWGWALQSSAAPTGSRPLRARPSAGRRVVLADLPLADVRLVHTRLGVAVHDVVLAVVAGATGELLASRGMETDGRWLRVLAPVAVGADGLPAVASSFVSVPMGGDDPVDRAHIVAEATARVRASHRTLPAHALLGTGAVAPSALHAGAVQLAARAPSYDLLVSNVPGPRGAVHALGGTLRASYPLLPLSGDHALAVGCTSVADRLCVSVTGAVGASATVMADLLVQALAELVAASAVVGAEDADAALTPPRHRARPRPPARAS